MGKRWYRESKSTSVEQWSCRRHICTLRHPTHGRLTALRAVRAAFHCLELLLCEDQSVRLKAGWCYWGEPTDCVETLALIQYLNRLTQINIWFCRDGYKSFSGSSNICSYWENWEFENNNYCGSVFGFRGIRAGRGEVVRAGLHVATQLIVLFQSIPGSGRTKTEQRYSVLLN